MTLGALRLFSAEQSGSTSNRKESVEICIGRVWLAHRMQEDVVRLPQPGPLYAGDFVQLVTARSVGLEP
jgi:hypothetical protein